MGRFNFFILFIPLVMGFTVSCRIIREHDIPDDYNKPIEREPLTFEFRGVSLKFDLSQMNQKDNIYLDFNELCDNHLASNNGSLTSEIKQFDHILKYEDRFEDKRKPSITVKISSLFHGDTTKVFSKDEVAPYALLKVPNFQDYISHTLTFKSIVTEENGLQVVWEDSSTGVDGWEELSITGNTITVDDDYESLSVIVKSGLNISRGDFAARNNGDNYDIIPNTVEDEEEIEELMEENSEMLQEVFCEEDNPVFSPFYLRPIYSGGKFQSNMRWRIPTILTIGVND